MQTPRHTVVTHDGRTLGKGHTTQQRTTARTRTHGAAGALPPAADKHPKSTNMRTTRAQARAAAVESKDGENVDTSNSREEKPVWKGVRVYYLVVVLHVCWAVSGVRFKGGEINERR